MHAAPRAGSRGVRRRGGASRIGHAPPWQHPHVDDDARRDARLALSLAEAVARDDDAAEPFLVDAFDDVADAAEAHAYLSGFLLTVVADLRHESPADAAVYVRRLLGGD